MSLRVRLALWYGGLTGLVVLLMGVLTYAEHTRAHYDDMDRTLIDTAVHISDEYAKATTMTQVTAVLAARIDPDVVLRVYGNDGTLIASSPTAPSAPAIHPSSILAHPSVRPFDWLAALAPSNLPVDVGQGRLGLVSARGDGRWRVYVFPLTGHGRSLVAAAPLDRMDGAIAHFRRLVLLFTVLGGVMTLVAGWLLAGRALRPVAVLTDTAAGIARSRGFTQRIPIGHEQDEMGRMAQTFNQMLDSLEQAYRLQQRFVADASHELRAPLTAIQGNLELLQRQPSMSSAERQESVDEASREAQRLARLVAGLLLLARADAGTTVRQELVELDRVLLDAVREARHLVRGQCLEIVDLEPTMVCGDPDRLQQLFVILLDNALKYTAAGGHITVALRRVAANAEVTVCDTGIGIARRDLPHVFERFYRADPARGRDPGGAGLGLAIAWWIVARHGGKIGLDSTPGVGTSVTLRIPALA